MGLGEGKGEGNLVPRSHISTFPNRLRSRYEIRGKGEGKGEWVVCVCVCVGGGGGGIEVNCLLFTNIFGKSGWNVNGTRLSWVVPVNHFTEETELLKSKRD